MCKILDFGLAKLLEAPGLSPEEEERDLKRRGLSRADTASSSSDSRGLPLRSELKPARKDNHAIRNGTAEAVPLQVHIPIDHTLTRTGLAMGTAGYMSPEQVRGENAGCAD